MNEEHKLIIEIMALAYLIQVETPHAVFIDYHGHVDSLQIKIVESAERYQTELAETEFNLDRYNKYKGDALQHLKYKRNILLAVIDTQEVDTSAMVEVVEKIYSHHF